MQTGPFRKAPAGVLAAAASRLVFAGWFLARPRAISDVLGIPPSRTSRNLTRAVGVRELVLGAGTLVAVARRRRTAPWLTAMAVAEAVNGTATLAAATTGTVAWRRALGLAVFDYSGTVWELTTARRLNRR